MFSGNTHKILRCSCIRRPIVISHQSIQFLYISIILYDCVALRFSKFQTQKHIKKTIFLRSASQANLLCSGVTSESQECYPKSHLTSKSFRFVLFRPFSVLFRLPKSNYLFKLLPHMSRPLKKKAIGMICFESQEWYPKADLTSKSFRFVLFRPFSVLFRPPKSNYLFKLFASHV